MSHRDTQLPRGALYVALGQATFVLSGFALHLVLTRWLTQAMFGVFNVVMTVLVWLEITVNNGVPVALQRYDAFPDSYFKHGGKVKVIKVPCLFREPAAAGLEPRHHRLLNKEHIYSLPGEVIRAGRARRPGADYYYRIMLHREIYIYRKDTKNAKR